MPRLLSDDDETMLFLGESLTDAYVQGAVEHRLSLAVAALLPNVQFIRLSIPWQADGVRTMVSVSNLAEEGLTQLHCTPAEDSAAAVCVRNAVPCVCTRPDYDDLADAFGDYRCPVVLCLPVSKHGVSSLSGDGLITHSGPVAAALMAGFAPGEVVTERDLRFLVGIAAKMSANVNTIVRDFLPELMGDTACRPSLLRPGLLASPDTCSLGTIRCRSSDDDPSTGSSLCVFDSVASEVAEAAMPLHVLGSYLPLRRRVRRSSSTTTSRATATSSAPAVAATSAAVRTVQQRVHERAAGEGRSSSRRLSSALARPTPATSASAPPVDGRAQQLAAPSVTSTSVAGAPQAVRYRAAGPAAGGAFEAWQTLSLQGLNGLGLLELAPNLAVQRVLDSRAQLHNVDRALEAALEAALGQGVLAGSLGAPATISVRLAPHDVSCLAASNTTATSSGGAHSSSSASEREAASASEREDAGASEREDAGGMQLVEGKSSRCTGSEREAPVGGGAAGGRGEEAGLDKLQRHAAAPGLSQQSLWLPLAGNRVTEAQFARWLAAVHHVVDIVWYAMSALVLLCLSMCAPYGHDPRSRIFLLLGAVMLGPLALALCWRDFHQRHREPVLLAHTLVYLVARSLMVEMAFDLMPVSQLLRISNLSALLGLEGMVAPLLLHLRMPWFAALIVCYLASAWSVPARMVALLLLGGSWRLTTALHILQLAAAGLAVWVQHVLERRVRHLWHMEQQAWQATAVVTAAVH